MTFYQFLAVLRARWGVVLGVFLACVLVTQVRTLRAPKLYTAVASVVVNSKSDPITAASYATATNSNDLETQTDIVTSPRVAARVVKALGFDQDPAIKQMWLRTTSGHGDFNGWLADAVGRTISVPPPRESNVISIIATWDNAKDAARIANAFAQAYIDTTIELRVEPAKQYAAWFDERSKSLRADLAARQKLLSDFQDKEGIFATDEHLDIEMSRLAELSAQLVAVQGQREDSQSREFESNNSDNMMPEVLQSTLITSLKSQLSTDEARLQDLKTRLGLNHPDYLRLQAEIDSLKARIVQETGNVVRSFRIATQINLRRETALTAAIDAQKKRVMEFKLEREHAAILQNDVATAQRNLDTVTQGLAQTSLESQAQQANAVQLSLATEPAAASSPKFLLNLALGLVFGIALGVVAAVCLELLNPRVRRSAELPRLLGVPLLATLSTRSGPKPRLFAAMASRALEWRGRGVRALGHDPTPSSS